MLLQSITFVLFSTGIFIVEGARIEGVVVNGTHGDVPVAGAEVVLRAGTGGSLKPVAETASDPDGRFVFDRIPVEPESVYLPGANYQGVHYPGLRLPPSLSTAMPPIKLTVFDAVASPNPLIVERREIDVKVQTDVLEITETLVMDNPTLTTYVGLDMADVPHQTLALEIPSDFERVTFASEFHGRRFKIVDKRLVTDIPWTPGRRKLEFTYRVPFRPALAWSVDAPCRWARVSVRGNHAEKATCTLPQVADPAPGQSLFESSDGGLPGRSTLTLKLGGFPPPGIVYARWTALALLAGLVAATTAFLRRRKAWRPSGTRNGCSGLTPCDTLLKGKALRVGTKLEGRRP
jgi:hypothetical protein